MNECEEGRSEPRLRNRGVYILRNCGLSLPFPQHCHHRPVRVCVASVRLSGRPWIWVATNPFTSAVLLIKRQTPQLSGFPLIDLEREWVLSDVARRFQLENTPHRSHLEGVDGGG